MSDYDDHSTFWDAINKAAKEDRQKEESKKIKNFIDTHFLVGSIPKNIFKENKDEQV